MDENFYINLIYKKLSGELTPPEKEQLNAWLGQSADNRLTAASVEKAWQVSDALQPEVSVDLDKEFAALEQKMDKGSSAPQKETIIKPIKEKGNTRRNWLSIAAGILLLASAAFLLRNYFGNIAEPNQPLEWVRISTGEEGQTVTLPDNSKVYLNKKSKMDYPNKFTEDNRMIKLMGEAFFEVEHNPQKPFVVQTNYEEITVLGTSFNVNTSRSELTTVYVATGKVELKQRNSSRKVILQKGEKGESSTRTGQVNNKGKQVPNDLSWRTNRLEFVDTPMNEVLTQVSKLYGVKFGIANQKLRDCTLTSTFDKQNIEAVLETFTTVFDLKIDKKTDINYILEGGSCD